MFHRLFPRPLTTLTTDDRLFKRRCDKPGRASRNAPPRPGTGPRLPTAGKSFAAAAGPLGITPAAVGQRVKVLENYLGMELLSRTRGGLEPTPALQAALPRLASAFADLEAAAQDLELQRGHELHIAAASDLVDLWLAPRLDRFRAAHPNVRFCINGEGDAPLRLGRVDCEIRYGPVLADPREDLLFRDYVVPVASATNVRRTAALDAALRLEGFPLVHVDFFKDDPAGLSWPDWVAAHGVTRSAPQRGMRFRRITAALDAILANAGVGLCGLALLGDRLDQGELALPYPVASGRWSQHGFVARFRPDSGGRRLLARSRAWLRDEARQTVLWLETTASGAASP
ncbi:LysR substrate-binding domain-containing protein [Brevundimonas sp. LM2]|uniref:LysR substrate-binding domain-containing protein n=1 Tax=Brevundimonas sp. LM2 TaxID=1938605 RepID=UPI0009855B64|nr:LysR substrate-binding domain-containing protein [Brevundimonas sp. LM2]